MRNFCLLLLIWVFYANVSLAEDFRSNIIQTPESAAQIIVEKQSAMRGEELWVALKLDLADGWHSYANPSGESGYATEISIELPKNVVRSDIYWQNASEFLTDNIISYGYADEAHHFVKLDISSDYDSDKLPLKIKAKWLVCKDICIPQSGEWSLRIPIINEANEADEIFTKRRNDSTLGAAKIISQQNKINASNKVNAPDYSISVAIISALLGGLILNLMPCVLPILSLKTLSLVKIAGNSRSLSALHGISYTSGIISGFLGLALLLIGLQQGGASVGWGFQLQSPEVIAALALLMLAIALNLSGVFELPSFGANIAAEKTSKSGLFASFLTGLLAVMVAAPCTAPFMAGAIGFAITQTIAIQLAIFASLGLGLALPYLIISLFPQLQRFLPKSGAWLVKFKQFLAFPIYATSAWLAWVLTRQAGSDALATLLAGALSFSLIIWLMGQWCNCKIWRIFFMLALFFTVYLTIIEVKPNSTANNIAAISQPYTPQQLAQLKAENAHILVYATSDWCITCKLNERLVLNDIDVLQHLEKTGIIVLKADFTSGNSDVAQLLQQNNLAGVPAYIYYADDKVQILPNLLSRSDILQLQ